MLGRYIPFLTIVFINKVQNVAPLRSVFNNHFDKTGYIINYY